jgi:cytoskeletal protein CcmA (bactofilin family)
MAIFSNASAAKKEAASFSPDPAPFVEKRASNDHPGAQAQPQRATDAAPKESLIAADLTIEGRIEGAGSIRIAGRFKGDVQVQGDLTIEAGAKLTGGVRASKVVVAGELEGNIESAARVELLESGAMTGDLKAGSLTVAAGSRMRGHVDCGWESKDAHKPAKAESQAAP